MTVIDPYDWLAIPQAQRPPTFYQLLGVSPGEREAQALETEAARRMEHVRKYQLRYPSESTRLQNANARALATLLDPDARATYDRLLAEGQPPDLEGASPLLLGAAAPSLRRRPRKPRGPKRSQVRNPRRRIAILLVALAVGALFPVLAVGVYRFCRQQAERFKEQLATAAPSPAAREPQPPLPVQPKSAPPGERAAPAGPPPESAKPPAPSRPPGNPVPAPLPPGPAAPQAPVPAPAQPGARQTVPGVEELNQAEAAIRARFKAEFQRQNPKDKATLADKLLQTARGEKTSSSRFVLLQLSMDLGMEAGQLFTPWLAIDAMAVDYDVDRLLLRTAALEMASQSADALIGKGLAERALGLLDDAVILNDYETATHLLQLADTGAGRALKPVELRERVAAERDRIRGLQRQFEEYLKAVERLTAAPHDADAQLAMGRYLCLVNGDWNAGLEHLARGADAALAELARQDLDGPATPAEQTQVGNGWYARGDKEANPARASLYARARYWYRQALSWGLGGKQTELKDRVKRIEQLARALSADLRATFYPDVIEERKPGRAPERWVENAPRRPRRTTPPNSAPQPAQPGGTFIVGGAGGVAGGGGGPASFGGLFRGGGGMIFRR